MPDDGTAMSSIQDARSGRPWWQVCCAGCLLLIGAVFVGGWLLFRGGSGPASTHLTALPDTFPKDIQLYRIQDASSITYIQGKNTNKLLQTIMAPIRLLAGGSAVTSTASAISTSTTPNIRSAIQVLDTYAEAFKGMDTVIVSWDNVSSTRQDVMDYYASSFARGGFTSTSTRDTVTGTDVLVATRQGASVQLQLQETAQGQGIEAMVAAVSYSIKP